MSHSLLTPWQPSKENQNDTAPQNCPLSADNRYNSFPGAVFPEESGWPDIQQGCVSSFPNLVSITDLLPRTTRLFQQHWPNYGELQPERPCTLQLTHGSFGKVRSLGELMESIPEAWRMEYCSKEHTERTSTTTTASCSNRKHQTAPGLVFCDLLGRRCKEPGVQKSMYDTSNSLANEISCINFSQTNTKPAAMPHEMVFILVLSVI